MDRFGEFHQRFDDRGGRQAGGFAVIVALCGVFGVKRFERPAVQCGLFRSDGSLFGQGRQPAGEISSYRSTEI